MGVISLLIFQSLSGFAYHWSCYVSGLLRNLDLGWAIVLCWLLSSREGKGQTMVLGNKCTMPCLFCSAPQGPVLPTVLFNCSMSLSRDLDRGVICVLIISRSFLLHTMGTVETLNLLLESVTDWMMVDTLMCNPDKVENCSLALSVHLEMEYLLCWLVWLLPYIFSGLGVFLDLMLLPEPQVVPEAKSAFY